MKFLIYITCIIVLLTQTVVLSQKQVITKVSSELFDLKKALADGTPTHFLRIKYYKAV